MTHEVARMISIFCYTNPGKWLGPRDIFAYKFRRELVHVARHACPEPLESKFVGHVPYFRCPKRKVHKLQSWVGEIPRSSDHG